MTRDEFDAKGGIAFCRQCGTDAMCEAYLHPSDGEHPGGYRCCECGGFCAWFSKPENKDKRPSLSSERIRAVWDEYGNVCAHCGIARSVLEQAKVKLTAQHVPPYKDGGTLLIPYCDHCQQRSAAEINRVNIIRRLVEQLAEEKEL
jgi:hypothetical protein